MSIGIFWWLLSGGYKSNLSLLHCPSPLQITNQFITSLYKFYASIFYLSSLEMHNEGKDLQ